MKRKTVNREFSFSGIGIHTGNEVNVTVKPAQSGYGIIFKRVDLDQDNEIIVRVESIVKAPLGSSITNGVAYIKTMEHFMAVLSAFEITDVLVEMDGEEMPILEGSSVGYQSFFANIGIKELDEDVKYITLKEPLWMENNGTTLIYFPSDKLTISYFVDYNDDTIGKQQFEYEHNLNNFEQINRARTFCFYKDVEMMRERGLGLGGSLDNALVVDDNGYMSELKYDNEPVRHKVLDLVGDIYLLGLPIKGHIVAIKSNHAFNGVFATEIMRQYSLKGE